jgi:hypothetical protein
MCTTVLLCRIRPTLWCLWVVTWQDHVTCGSYSVERAMTNHRIGIVPRRDSSRSLPAKILALPAIIHRSVRRHVADGGALALRQR